jgi:formyltetrahydrofolate hydrolase
MLRYCDWAGQRRRPGARHRGAGQPLQHDVQGKLVLGQLRLKWHGAKEVGTAAFCAHSGQLLARPSPRTPAQISYADKLKRVAVLVSKQDHCLYDLLIRHRSGELRCHIPLVISNHEDLGEVATTFGIPFKHLALESKDAKQVRVLAQEQWARAASATELTRARGPAQAQEAALEALLEKEQIDVIVLARYMQVIARTNGPYCV